MQIGMIGLGRMGSSMVRRLHAQGHTCFAHARQASVVAELVAIGATGAASIAELVSKMTRPRSIWLMVPAAAVDQVLSE